MMSDEDEVADLTASETNSLLAAEGNTGSLQRVGQARAHAYPILLDTAQYDEEIRRDRRRAAILNILALSVVCCLQV